MDPVRLVEHVTYKPGWRFKIGGPGRRFVCVFARTPDSLAPACERVTQHMFEIPDIDDPPGFYRWLFDRLLDAERHEAAEFFRVGGAAPFWPNHQDEGSPYAHVERHIAWPCTPSPPVSAGS